MCYLWMKLWKRRLTDLEFHPTEFRYLFLSGFLLKKKTQVEFRLAVSY